jgi:hypothetical protein
MWIYKVQDNRKQRTGKGRYVTKGQYAGYFAVKFAGYEVEYWSNRGQHANYAVTLDLNRKVA